MGCDYYKGTFLTIIYTDESGNQQEKIIQLEKEDAYFVELKIAIHKI